MNLPPLPQFKYSFINQGSGVVDINIDGDIVDAPTQEFYKNWFGDESSVSFKSFRDQIENVNPSVINLYVNSLGGAVSEAMAMHDYLNEKESKGVTVNRKGRGIIASAATYLMMGKNSEMSENSMMMIHNVQMQVQGDINDVEQQVKTGRKFNNLVRDFYVNQTGQAPETVSAWMNKETWFNAQEAKDYGFVKNISGQASFKNSIKAERWPFENKAILNTYNSFTTNKKANMKVETISAAIKNALVQSGVIKNSIKNDDTLITKMADEIANSIKTEVEAGINERITNAVSAAMKNGGTVNVKETVSNELAEILKETGEGSVSALINSAVADAVGKAVAGATTNVATNENITKLQNELTALAKDVANKLGGKGTASEEETETDRKVNNKRGFFKVGNFGKTA